MLKALIFLTLFGCDDSATLCDLLAEPVESYQTMAQCQSAADELLDHSLDRPYPMLMTQCGTEAETLDYIAQVGEPGQMAAFAQSVAAVQPH